MKQFLLSVLFTAACLLPNFSWAQGITTASMSGVVSAADGSTLPGANVIAVHEPTGTRYGAATRADGRFTIPAMQVGGPYNVTVSFVGYEPKVYNGINLKLGQEYVLNTSLTEEGGVLEEVEITANTNPVMNSERTGAATNVTEEQLESLPTISRGLNDFTRLTPQASTAGGSGISFAGQNNRYNQFAIDGTVNNDVFGLSATGTNGGQTGVQPISLDAIQEVQVVIAPYSVLQGGFTGAGINAVTRSGTNNFTGSAYYFGNNEKLVGKSPDEARTRLDDYTDYQTGFRLGGPIVPNKLFFFVNGEVTNRTSPLLFAPGTSSSNITIDELERVVDVAERLGYDPGQYASLSDERSSEKIFGRLDWNINDNHRLTLRHSYVYGQELDFTRNPNQVNFSNAGVFFPTTTNSTVLELNSRIGANMSNTFRLGYTTVRDDREALGSPFPAVNIRLSGGRQINLGSEAFSVANQLDQDVFTITNNFTYYMGKHAITLGTHNEFYSTYNLFIRENYGAYRYDNRVIDGVQYSGLDLFELVGTENEVVPTQYSRSYSRTNNPMQGAEFNAYQLGFYLQDEFEAARNLMLTAGVRIDVPTFSETPGVNEAFNAAFGEEYGVATNELPGAQVMFSPRLGFNWKATESGTTQVRGGVGMFTGRLPFVWLSNQYTNTGLVIGSAFVNLRSTPEDFRFNPDPFSQPTSADLGRSESAAEINVTDPDFKFPKVFRANLAVDQELPGGIVGTLEGIFTKNLRNIDYRNLNVQQDGTLAGADNRPYFSDEFRNNNFNNVLLLTNTSEGYAYNASATLQKFFNNGLRTSVSYNYGVAKDVNAGTSSQAYSNWRYVENVYGPNTPELGYSDFDVRSRVVAALSYKLRYESGSATTLSLFYNGQSGIPFSYVYGDDINNDNTAGNDLIYVPASSSEVQFSGSEQEQIAQWNALNAYIEADDYLSERRGQYAERNGARLPWTNQVDLRLMHEIKLNIVGETDHRIQLTFDVFNLGNLINADWGRQYSITNNSFSLIDVSVDPDSRVPVYTYTGEGLNDGNPYFVSDFLSRWRGQFGIRYIFGGD
ncbi:carboxypeptidase regulatory-like domain-containing protein [Cesiribacter sp. SM1]|uniref:TonB-dependent receptor n=1 Tax=Cesiribacter sp. SM1 TaxID=2861196 RepID=UPI001CD1F5D0|nr:carboxypeptidase regulatory-like domain-containing protein [Cesiribacter sp. SM1]